MDMFYVNMGKELNMGKYVAFDKGGKDRVAIRYSSKNKIDFQNVDKSHEIKNRRKQYAWKTFFTPGIILKPVADKKLIRSD